MENFDGILQHIQEDDFVEYYLFPPIESVIELEQEKKLSSILAKANKIIETHTKDFLWHKDGFKLSSRTLVYNKLNNVGENGKEKK